MLFIAILDSVYYNIISLIVFFFVAVNDNGIEYSWVILHCHVHSHASKQVSYLSVHKTLGV